MILLGVSGGPDSMYLLDLLYNKRKDIVVATVNYNVRENSSYDVEVVRKYCQEKEIIFEHLEIDKNACFKGNFEQWARNIRFDFFKKLYEKYNCEALYLAHQKDDFIESYFMQKESNRKPDFFGIKAQNEIFGMNVLRPLVNTVFKSEILEYLHKNKIDYAYDYTNDLTIYTRNKIRNRLKNLSNREKSKIIDEINKLNQNLQMTENEVLSEYDEWKNTNFSQDTFAKLKNKDRLVYKLIYEKFSNISLSKGKINSVAEFILSKNRTSNYLLKNDVFMQKKHGKLVF
ncbi:tRNA lysidine(34) synthetase TilS [Mycoplasmopsis bovis]|uniref:tRNA lysidine(34) synthetase TilS n=1 Tax=Mycoplasmopsis bovis TaxID=28903 RepID=UPI000653FF6F|nr:tRNA lysidine(34) synthetase TilS [Mycoplasmopsis bovis]AKO50962.1 tRNA(Ile)-lysidine synthetase [Mycoplasmopsis bovis]TQF44543.1 tRNA lysidine(34) synthetase TilS [Mycoplasmopsis bovis]TQF57074.1 tRNA lysidine(34) synthetase TilS [Mycoplasmopsis bovis]